MDTGDARALMLKYVSAVAFIAIEGPDGTPGIGTATHVGEGVFLTARHVVEGNTITEVTSTERTYVPLPEGSMGGSMIHDTSGTWLGHEVRNENRTITRGPYFHPHDEVDLAAFVVDGLDGMTPWVPLGGHLDDWIGGVDFVLNEVVVMGYPPIPMTGRPYLVATRAEVNAQVDYYDTPHVHWIISAPARGGFSGAMVINEQGLCLGVVGRSVLLGDGPAELGFMSATSVEPIYVLLAEAKILPSCQSEGWDDLWNTQMTWLERPSPDGLGVVSPAHVEVYDDGRVLRMRIRVLDHPDLLAEAAGLAVGSLAPEPVTLEVDEPVAVAQTAERTPAAVAALHEASEVVLSLLERSLPGVTRRR